MNVYVTEETIGVYCNEVEWQVTLGAYDSLSKAMNSFDDLNLTWTCETDSLIDPKPQEELFRSNETDEGFTYWIGVLPIQ